MIKDTSKSTATKWYYRLPANSGSKLNLEKAYIPINWKDNSTWKVTYTATITYGSLNLSVTKNGSDEGHKHNWTEWDYVTKYNPETNQNEIQKDANGHYMTYSYSCSDYFSLLVDVVKSSYTSKSETITATAGVTVKGNMYEDDFTGSKK
jgi:hypothetical protein